MISKIKTLPQQTLAHSPLLDLSDPAVKELIRSAKKRGYVTHDQINSVLPRRRSIPRRSRTSSQTRPR